MDATLQPILAQPFAKAIDSLAERMRPYAWRDDPNSLRAKSCGACYEWYYSYAKQFQPAVVVEIGVQRGYSAIAFLLGHPGIRTLYLFDNDQDGYPLSEALSQIERAKAHVGSSAQLFPFHLDTQQTRTLPVYEPVDLAHVDGLHTFEGASHDLALILPHLRLGGVVVMDDLWLDGVRKAAENFSTQHPDWEHTQVPAHTTHQLSRRLH